MRTPYYVFDAEKLTDRLQMVRNVLPGIPVTYSIKANSFVTQVMCEAADHLEVCSPGELEICKKLQVPGDRIIYSGVMKEPVDIEAAVLAGAGILTAESPAHFRMIQQAAAEMGQTVRILLRLSSGNQFGMDQDTLLKVLSEGNSNPNAVVIGFHFYSGTQKKKAVQIGHDLDHLREVIQKARSMYGFEPSLIEYGPGLAVEYFKSDDAEADMTLLAEAAPLMQAFAEEAPLGVEFGRFLAAPCGTYYTSVKDLKMTDGVCYAILDGGIHHLKYYGQMMSMHQPPVHAVYPGEGDAVAYCLCGSLCTASDVLVREVLLPELHPGDVLAFEKCGAYSVTEASGLFLSRDLPAVYLRQHGELLPVRRAIPTWEINCPDFSLAEKRKDAASCKKD
ncbi:MAG: alanine racemase [Clostridia bacterium]|nr:alanine racemase [Clostridia bacterium]